jgi:hypothetical protein
MSTKNDVGVWSILKQCVGKELSKITMPVILNEPLSFLQRMVEYMEYAQLLVKASGSDDVIERLEMVTAFAVSATAANWERIGKPFNPLLGETYELDRKELGYRIVCEQVSHHPPVSAFHAESEHYMLHGSIHPKLKFWGKSVEVTPKGTITLHLLRHGEVYTWQNVNCSVNNVIVGKLWIEHFGTLEVTNHQTKHKAVLNFKASDMLGKDLHKVDGYLYDSNQHKIRALYGKWVEALYSYDVDVWENHSRSSCRGSESPCRLAATLVAKAKQLPLTDKSPQGNDDVPSKGSSCNLHLDGQKLLWEASPRPSESNMYYNFTAFAMTLNEPPASVPVINLPPTDSRWRPDMRKMEEGDIDAAASEKNRLEEKQRLARKDRKRKKEEWTPRWFRVTTNLYSGKDDWQFTSEYWKRNWTYCPSIF